MTSKEVRKLIEKEFKRVLNLFKEKGEEYVNSSNALQNFYDGAQMDKTTPEETCWGYFKKHILAEIKFLQDIKVSKKVPFKQWEEKIGDIILYHLLLKALLIERENGHAKKDSKYCR